MAIENKELIFKFAFGHPCDADAISAFVRARDLFQPDPPKMYYDVGDEQISSPVFKAMLDATEAYIRANCPNAKI